MQERKERLFPQGIKAESRQMIQRQTDSSIHLDSIRGIIFDVDGTLYEQKAVRLGMALLLFRFYLLHPWRIRELWGLALFRKIRENRHFLAVPMPEQIAAVSKKIGLPAERLQGTIQKWMFEKPLPLIAKHARQPVLTFLHRMQTEGKRIIIYSDYAPEEKLQVLGIVPDAVFFPGKAGINALKPSREGMQSILRAVSLPAEQLLFLGDREEKDGESARMVGIPFFLVSRKSSVQLLSALTPSIPSEESRITR